MHADEESSSSSAINVGPLPVAYDARGRRAREGNVFARLALFGDERVGKSMLIARLFRDCAPHTVLHAPYMQTTQVAVIDCREESEYSQWWDAPGARWLNTIAQVFVRTCSLVLLCYSAADPHALRSLTSWVSELRAEVDHPLPMLLVALRCDEPRAVTLDDVCAFAEQHRVRCFGTDTVALPIAYADWDGGRMPHAAAADEPDAALGALAAAQYAAHDSACAVQRIDWRAAFRARAARLGFGAARVCRAPVIEFSSAGVSFEQARWMAHLVHDIAIENALMDVGRLDM